MKRTMILVLSALLLLGSLSACSATGTVRDPMGYGNVSTTHNGYVNGTNRNMPGYDAVGNVIYDRAAPRAGVTGSASLLPEDASR